MIDSDALAAVFGKMTPAELKTVCEALLAALPPDTGEASAQMAADAMKSVNDKFPGLSRIKLDLSRSGIAR